MKQPYGYIRATVYNKPATGECAFYTTAWGGTADSASVLSADCSPQQIRPSAVVLDADSSVRMLAFAVSADHSTAQPLCGVNPVTIHPKSCTASLSAAETSTSTIAVTIALAQPGVRCEVYLTQWNSVDKKSLGLKKVSPDCSSVTFTAGEAGAAFVFGSGVYSFEYAELMDGSSTPSCSLNAVDFNSFTAAVCVNTTIHPIRPDPYSVSITLDQTAVKPYGLCRVRLVSYAGTTVSVARVGPCSNRFDFISDGGSIALTDGHVASFKYDFFPDGNVVGSSPSCSSVDPTNITLAFTCPTTMMERWEVPTGVQTVHIPAPQPVVGNCWVLFRTNFDLRDYPMSSCSSSGSYTFEFMKSFLTNELPGLTQTFKWKYFTPNMTLLCDENVLVNNYWYAMILGSMSVASTGPGLISVRSNGLPSLMPLFNGMGCRFTLVSCNNVAPSNTSPVNVANCSSNVTVTFSDATDVPVGATCRIAMSIYIVNDITNRVGYSANMTVVAAGIPAWGLAQTPTLKLVSNGGGDFSSSCIEVAWPVPSTSGGIPTHCYDVQRKDGTTGAYYSVNDACVTDLSTQVCDDFAEGVPFTFQVVAINRAGRSVDATCVSRTTKIESEYSDAATTYVSPSWAATQFPADTFPAVVVQESDLSEDSTGRLYVGRLISRCKLDDATGSIAVPLTQADANYTAVELPIPVNSPPAFTQVFTPVDGSAGSYVLNIPQPLPGGVYSLAVHSLESGGLLGQYWKNPIFSGAPAVTQKDSQIDFAWANDAIVLSANDLVTVRWTGFLEAAYGEEYTIIVDSMDNFRVWVDDVLVVDAWESQCEGECSGMITLEQSTEGSRKFHYVRVDYLHSKGIGRYRPAGISLQWVSFSQPREVIPATRLFKAPVIQGAVRSVTLLAGTFDASASSVTYPASAVVSGTPSEILITAKDAAGNVVMGSTDSFVATFSLLSVAIYTFASHPVDASLNDGRYTIPFTVPNANQYTVTVEETVSSSNLAGGNVNIVPGPASVITIGSIPAGVAGQASYIPVTLTDAANNPISGSGLAVMPPLFATANFTIDATAQSRLPVNDVAARAARYGSTVASSSVTWHSGTSSFRVAMTYLRAGAYSGQVGLVGGPAPQATSTITVQAAPTSAGIAAVVVTDPFPPTDLVMGIALNVSVQLRDQYMNPIATALSGTAPTVVIKLATQSGNTQQSCSLSVSTLGLFICAITPVAAGTDLPLSILVSGVHASHLSSVGSVVTRSQGPWAVNVTAGVPSGADSILLGVRSIYMVGLPADATLVLRDASHNVLGPRTAYPTIEAYFMLSSTKYSMDPTTFVFNADGSITIPILTTVASSGLSLFVKVDGTAVPMPYGIVSTAIVSKLGVVTAATSVCDSWVDMVAAAAQSITCVPKDAQSNSVGQNGLYIFSNFSYRADSSVSPVVLTGTFGSHQYSIATGGSVTKSGSYSVYTILCQPGGLLGQYFANADLTDVLAFNSAPISDPRHVDENAFVYSRIDPFIDFSSLSAFGGLSPASVRWSGYIMPPATASFTFRLIAAGGARLQVGTGTAQVDLLSASAVDDSVVVSLTAATPVAIVLEYVLSADPSITLTWVYSGSSPSTAFVVPPVALLAPLTASQQGGYLISVSIGPVSTSSTASFPGSYIAGVMDYIIVQAIDANFNSFTSDPTACVGATSGSVPTCLFFATMVVSDGTTFGTAVALGDGTIKIPVTFAAEGVVSVNVKLQTATGVYSAISGSPYSVTVNHA